MPARHKWITFAVALFGVIATISLARLQWSILQIQREQATSEEVRRTWNAFSIEIRRAEDLQDTIVAFLETAGDVEREQFNAFAARLPDVNFQAVSFAAYVPAARRADFERNMAAVAYPGAKIWQLDAEGQSTPAAARDAYFPVTYLYPPDGNTPALGFDLLSEARRRRALLAAIRGGGMARTDPIRLVQDPGLWGFLVFKPVYARSRDTSGSGARTAALLGVVSSVYQFGPLLERALDRSGTGGRQIALFDASEPQSPVYLHKSGTTARGKEDLDGPLKRVALLPGARVVSMNAMKQGLSAVFLPEDSAAAWWRRIDATIAATLTVGLLLTVALVWNLIRVYRLTAWLGVAMEDGRRRKEEAERASIAKSRILAYASHDLRQPLHALELFVGHLKERPLEYETAKIVGNIEQCVNALGDLLDSLLDLSQLESGAVHPLVKAVPVAELWQRLQGEFAEPAKEKRLALRFRPSPLWIRTDPQLMHRILLNLVSNAIRYTREGGVLVACRRSGRDARIEVWDTGAGIPEKEWQEVFKEFVQLNNPEGNRLKGLGLGLSIVQRSAVLLGHRLELKSVPGRGSCFSLEVPVADPVASPIESFRGRAGAEDHDFSGLTALVVEDDELARWALAALLRSWRCVVVEAATAEEAEQVLASGCRPNLIACDFRLPNHRNGVDLIQGVRATLGSEVAAFVLSGDTSEDVIKAVRSAGLPLLHKPVKAARLRRALQLLAVVRSAPRDSRDPARG